MTATPSLEDIDFDKVEIGNKRYICATYQDKVYRVKVPLDIWEAIEYAPNLIHPFVTALLNMIASGKVWKDLSKSRGILN